MHVVVIANGELPAGSEPASRRLLATADRAIAADGGLRHCAEIGMWPDLLVGDLDSAPPELVEQARANGVTVQSWPIDKDATDLELALAEAKRYGATQVTVLAAFGGRLDHEMATIGMLCSPEWAALRVTATDGRRSLWVVRTFVDLELTPGQTVSLIPWGGEIIGIATLGLQWPLLNDTLELGTTRGVSNVVTQEEQSVRISPRSEGVLLVIADPG